MKEHFIESTRKELRDIYSVVRNFSDEKILRGPKAPLRPPFDRLDRLAALEVEDEVVEQILCDETLDPVIDEIVRLRRLYGLRLEIEQAKSILAAPDPWCALKDFHFYTNYEHLARIEYKGAALEKGDKVAFLGSGPLPLSLIVLCHRYDIKGIGIEQVPEYAELSRKVLSRLGFSDSIQIVTGNQHTFPLKESIQLFMVASAAQPKREIFIHLAQVLPDRSKISYRIYEKGLRRLLDKKSFFEIPKTFMEYSRMRPTPPVNNTVVFLIKNTP